MIALRFIWFDMPDLRWQARRMGIDQCWVQSVYGHAANWRGICSWNCKSNSLLAPPIPKKPPSFELKIAAWGRIILSATIPLLTATPSCPPYLPFAFCLCGPRNFVSGFLYFCTIWTFNVRAVPAVQFFALQPSHSAIAIQFILTQLFRFPSCDFPLAATGCRGIKV